MVVSQVHLPETSGLTPSIGLGSCFLYQATSFSPTSTEESLSDQVEWSKLFSRLATDAAFGRSLSHGILAMEWMRTYTQTPEGAMITGFNTLVIPGGKMMYAMELILAQRVIDLLKLRADVATHHL